MSKQGKISRVISWIIIVLILVAVCGCLAYFTNGFTNDFATFFVVTDKTTHMDHTEDFVLPGTDNKFEVKYTFGAFQKELNGYSVKIIPNVTEETDFDFTVNGAVHSFMAEKDLTKGFEITQEEDYFILNGDFTLQEVLAKVYEGKEVVVDETHLGAFTLQVYSFDQSACVEIDFTQSVAVTGVELQDSIIFEEQPDGTVRVR